MIASSVLYKPGTLRRRSLQNRHDWREVFFQAAVDGQEFVDVKLLRLQDYYKDMIFSLAFESIDYGIDDNGYFDFKPIHQKARQIMDNGQIEVQPFISVTDAGICVCVDANKIDENITEDVLEILVQVGLTPGTVFFGKKRTYNSSEIYPDANKNQSPLSSDSTTIQRNWIS